MFNEVDKLRWWVSSFTRCSKMKSINLDPRLSLSYVVLDHEVDKPLATTGPDQLLKWLRNVKLAIRLSMVHKRSVGDPPLRNVELAIRLSMVRKRSVGNPPLNASLAHVRLRQGSYKLVIALNGGLSTLRM